MPDQLKMRRLTSVTLPDIVLPEGYSLRSYRDGDDETWADIITRSGDLGEHSAETTRQKLTGLTRFKPEGLLFIEAAGEPVATACAWRDRDDQWDTGQVHMVAVVPEHRGHRLSYWVSAAVCHVLRDWGMREVILTTDEFRKAAVKVYLNLGFLPVIRNESHWDRWAAVYAEYGITGLAEHMRNRAIV